MMKITTGFRALVANAEKETEALTPTEVDERIGREGTLVVDLRDIREVKREGRIPGSVHVPRGMLEFWIDPESPYYREDFGSGKKFIFYCAGGLRSALAAQSVHRMGLAPVAHMAGGYGAWVAADGPTVEKEARLPKPKAD